MQLMQCTRFGKASRLESICDFDRNVGKMQSIVISVSAEEVSAPILIPNFGIGFGSRYRYRISVGHYQPPTHLFDDVIIEWSPTQYI